MRASRLAVLIHLLAVSSFGWDDDVHVKMLFAMCRKAAIAPELCLKIALNAGWVDEAASTTPMFPTFFIGAEVRRRRHFPGNRERLGQSTQHGMSGLGNYMALGAPNSPVANMLLVEGFHRGDFTMVGAGLHVLMDSFTHNHLAHFGHTDRGHHPDRPWTYLLSDPITGKLYNPRFLDMVPVVFQALCSLRDLIPEIGIDKTMHSSSGILSHTLGADELASDFIKLPLFESLSTWKTTWSPRYTIEAMKNLLQLAKTNGSLSKDFDVNRVLPRDEEHVGDTDPFEMFLGIVKKLIQIDLGDNGRFGDILNVAKLREGPLAGYPLENVHFVDMSPQEQERFLRYATRAFTKGHLPIPLGMYNESAWEVEGENRNLEMSLRHAAWDSFIENVIGPESFDFVSPPQGFKGIPALFCNNVGDWCITKGGKEAISISGIERVKFNWKMTTDLLRHFHRNAPNYTMGYQYPREWQSQIENGAVRPVLRETDVIRLIAERLSSLKRQGLTGRAKTCEERLLKSQGT